MMNFEWYCHGFRLCFFRFSQVNLFAILTPCFWNEFEYVVKIWHDDISSISTITKCWEDKVELITLIWSLLSCNSSLIWSVFIIPLLLRYPIVHVEPPTVTVYLRIIVFGFWTSITVSRQTKVLFICISLLMIYITLLELQFCNKQTLMQTSLDLNYEFFPDKPKNKSNHV